MAGLQDGITVFDAESDRELDRVAQIGRQYRGRVLWCGSGGLAGALARATDASVPRQLDAPVLGIFGSDHPATSAQLSMCDSVLVRTDDVKSSIDRIKRTLDRGVALVALPQIFSGIGPAGALLLLSGGVFYTVGAVVYALRRPDPRPATFGYHEIFHSLVIAAVVCQYATVAFYVLPRA